MAFPPAWAALYFFIRLLMNGNNHHIQNHGPNIPSKPSLGSSSQQHDDTSRSRITTGYGDTTDGYTTDGYTMNTMKRTSWFNSGNPMKSQSSTQFKSSNQNIQTTKLRSTLPDKTSHETTTDGTRRQVSPHAMLLAVEFFARSLYGSIARNVVGSVYSDANLIHAANKALENKEKAQKGFSDFILKKKIPLPTILQPSALKCMTVWWNILPEKEKAKRLRTLMDEMSDLEWQKIITKTKKEFVAETGIKIAHILMSKKDVYPYGCDGI